MEAFLIFIVGVFIGIVFASLSPNVVVVTKTKDGLKYVNHESTIYRLIPVEGKEVDGQRNKRT